MLYMFPLKIYPSFEIKEHAGLKPTLLTAFNRNLLFTEMSL